METIDFFKFATWGLFFLFLFLQNRKSRNEIRATVDRLKGIEATVRHIEQLESRRTS